MKKIVLAVSLVALAGPGFAAEKTEATPPARDPMADWVPPQVKNEKGDRKEILALFKTMEDAEKKGDLGAAAALVDFPVLMVTDDREGQAMSGSWDREKWTQVMEPFYKHPMQGMRVAHKPVIFLISDSLASVDDQTTITHGKRTIHARNSTLLVKKDGKWLVKAMAEGGWGQVMKEHTASSGGTSPRTGAGAGSKEMGTGAGTEAPTGTGARPGSAPAAPPPRGSPSDATK
jgi:uncharacterized protein (TIGR02246 family)